MSNTDSTTVVIAPTRDIGRGFIAAHGGSLKGAVVITPRSLNGLRGVRNVAKVVTTNHPMYLSADFIANLAMSLETV